SKPLMTTFMNDNKVPFQPPSRTRAIPAQVAVLIAISISHRTLMLHTQVRRIHQLITILVKGVGAKPMLEGPQHRLHITGEMHLSFFQVFAEHPIIDIEYTLLTLQRIGEMYIVTYIERHRIIINGLLYQPIVPCIAPFQFRFTTQSTVRDIH